MLLSCLLHNIFCNIFSQNGSFRIVFIDGFEQNIFVTDFCYYYGLLDFVLCNNNNIYKDSLDSGAKITKRISRRKSVFNCKFMENVKFLLTYRDSEKLVPLVREISWSNNIIIAEKCKDNLEREFYSGCCQTTLFSCILK